MTYRSTRPSSLSTSVLGPTDSGSSAPRVVRPSRAFEASPRGVPERAHRSLLNERGAVHVFGFFLALISIYSTYLMLRQNVESQIMQSVVVDQKKKIDMLELKLQVLEMKVAR